jgi:protoporphyrinogen oxidase
MNLMSIKKIVYVILTIIFGQLISLLAYEISLAEYIKAMLYQNITVSNYLGIFYNPADVHTFWIFIGFGSVFGFFLGLHWWRMVYVEHKYWRKPVSTPDPFQK